MKAIETRYKGYRFRSRLEARWAVFFDALGLKWDYETEGFDLDDAGWYLPDFWFPLNCAQKEKYPNGGYWVEIKSRPLNSYEEKKCMVLAKETGSHVTSLCGQPWPREFVETKYFRDGGSKVISVGDIPPGIIVYPCLANSLGCPDFESAFRAARAARFEHGERP